MTTPDYSDNYDYTEVPEGSNDAYYDAREGGLSHEEALIEVEEWFERNEDELARATHEDLRDYRGY